MNYEKAKAILEKNSYDFNYMIETREIENYRSYNVPKELEAQWIKEFIDRESKSFSQKLNNGELAKDEMFYISSLGKYMDEKVVMDLYNSIRANISKIDPKSEVVYYYCLSTALDGTETLEQMNDENYNYFIDGMRERLDIIFKENMDIQKRFQHLYNWCEDMLAQKNQQL